MFRLLEALNGDPDSNHTYLRKEKPSDKMNYYGWNKSEIPWVPPNFTNGEGPVVMLDRPFRMDCSNCGNRELEFPNGVKAEWIGVEYSRDVAFPTFQTTTSQETAALYIGQKRNKERTACVTNAGLHDMKIDPRLSTEVHVKNVRDYQRHLKRQCSVVIFYEFAFFFGQWTCWRLEGAAATYRLRICY
jgi:hypothetical protein